MRVRMISPNRELQRQIDLRTRTDSPSRHIGEKLLSRRLDASRSEKSLYSAQNFPRLAHGQSPNRSAPCNTVTPVDIPITVEPVHELSDSHGEKPPGESPLRVADLKEYKTFTVKDVNDILAEQNRKKSPKDIIFELYREKYGYFVPVATGADTPSEPR